MLILLSLLSQVPGERLWRYNSPLLGSQHRDAAVHSQRWVQGVVGGQLPPVPLKQDRPPVLCGLGLPSGEWSSSFALS